MFPFTFRSRRGSLLAGALALAVVVSVCDPSDGWPNVFVTIVGSGRTGCYG